MSSGNRETDFTTSRFKPSLLKAGLFTKRCLNSRHFGYGLLFASSVLYGGTLANAVPVAASKLRPAALSAPMNRTLAPPSPAIMERARQLMNKPATWDQIPKEVTLCVYSPDGIHGKGFQYAMSYLSELPKYAQYAEKIGISLKLTSLSDLQKRLDLHSNTLNRDSSTLINFRVYTDERVASEDFKAKKCDGVGISNLRARQYNAFVGSLDALGAVPSYAHLTEVIGLLAKPEMANYMVNKDYEITGIFPMGAAYIMVDDRSINTLSKAAGKKVAVLDFDKSQAKLVQKVGAQPVSVDLTSLAGKFNNHQVNIMAGPALLFKPFELYKGMTDSNGAVKGAIIRFPIVQVTGVIMMHRKRFPDGVGQLVREFSAGQLEPAYQFVDSIEKDIDPKYWMDLPASDKLGYQKLMREARIDMTKQGFYDPRMMHLLKLVRCKQDPTQFECSMDDE